jgi:predicted metal-dependent hydrolase
MRFDHIHQLKAGLLAGVSAHWNGNDPFRSHFYNTLSLFGPDAEQFVIDVVREFRPSPGSVVPTDAALRQLTSQEATHRSLHAAYNDALIAQGYRNFIGPSIARATSRMAHLGRMGRLASVAAFEHMTTIISEDWFVNRLPAGTMDETVAGLFSFHFTDELEHKSVAFDLYRAEGGGYFCRSFWFIAASNAYFFRLIAQIVLLLRKDGMLFSLRTLVSMVSFFFGRRGLAWYAVPLWLIYFKPGFHPDQHDHARVLLEARADAKVGAKPGVDSGLSTH